MPASRLLALALAAPHAVLALETTDEIWGQMAPIDDPDNLNQIMSCFYGVGFTRCTFDEAAALAASGDEVDLTGAFPDFSYDATYPADRAFCIQCCSNRRLAFEIDDTLVLRCDFTNDRDTRDSRSKNFQVISNYDWEFRFARRETSADDTIVRCPLERIDPTAYIVGYELTLNVLERSASGFSFWRGVESCSATAIESSDSTVLGTKVFTEQIRLVGGSADASASFMLYLAFSLICAACFAFFMWMFKH